jgi:single-stranded DNA-binding protein
MNVVVLSGVLAKDAEIQLVGQKGAKKAILSLLVNVSRWDTSAGGFVESPVTIKTEVWNSKKKASADEAENSGKAGTKVMVKGYIDIDSWVDKNTKETRSMMKIKTEDVDFMGEGGSASPGAQDFDKQDVPF